MGKSTTQLKGTGKTINHIWRIRRKELKIIPVFGLVVPMTEAGNKERSRCEAMKMTSWFDLVRVKS